MGSRIWILVGALVLSVTLVVVVGGGIVPLGGGRAVDAAIVSSESESSSPAPLAGDSLQTIAAAGDIIVLAWNDLGMHCYNRDFQYLAVLPPANTLWAQVLRVGDPPQVITTGITVTYQLIDNSFSVGKSNFWTYAKALYGVDLAPNIGLAGFGLSGTMAMEADHFVAEWIPLTEFTDSAYNANPANPQPNPFQQARIEVWDATTGQKLAEVVTVAPVSTEMHCDYCHSDNGRGNRNIATGSVELNILTAHDQENAEDYPAGHTGLLANRTPIRCSECHPSNATPGLPTVPTMPSLSRVMHRTHAEQIPSTREGCYNCHPGPQTQCQRGVMSYVYGIECPQCHGSMSTVGSNPNPWLNEPRCDNMACHPADTYTAGVLYRNATDHGGIYCEGCHDSPHAIAPSRVAVDGMKFIALQGYDGALRRCTTCHATAPASGGPHDLLPLLPKVFLPTVMKESAGLAR